MSHIPMIQIGDVIISSDLLTEYFCCDLSACGGACCIEGDAGAPVTPEEVAAIEQAQSAAMPYLSTPAKDVIARQGVAYVDTEGDLVTSIVDGRDCVFTYYDAQGCCLCALERAYREGQTTFCKPISCYLYPIRVMPLSHGLTALNYHRWDVCKAAVKLGKKRKIPLWQFLKDPLITRFGQDFYDELTLVAEELYQQGLLKQGALS